MMNTAPDGVVTLIAVTGTVEVTIMLEEITTIAMIGIEVVIVMKGHRATGVSKAVIVVTKVAGAGITTMAADAAIGVGLSNQAGITTMVADVVAGAVNNNHSNQAGIIIMVGDVAAGAVNNNNSNRVEITTVVDVAISSNRLETITTEAAVAAKTVVAIASSRKTGVARVVVSIARPGSKDRYKILIKPPVLHGRLCRFINNCWL
jgi:hypothetical protein